MVGCGQPRKYGPWFACLGFVRRVVYAAGVLVWQLDDAWRRAAAGRNTRGVECDDHPRGRFASRLRSGVSLGGAHAGSYMAFNLPSEPCSFFLRSGGSSLKWSVALPKCPLAIRPVLRRLRAMRRGTAMAGDASQFSLRRRCRSLGAALHSLDCAW